jgi:hypothetical protein
MGNLEHVDRKEGEVLVYTTLAFRASSAEASCVQADDCICGEAGIEGG